jgi:hypothetical protein
MLTDELCIDSSDAPNLVLDAIYILNSLSVLKGVNG